MSNSLNDLLNVVQRKQKYRIGRIKNIQDSFCTIVDNFGIEKKVSGSINYYVGNYVLIEDDKIIGRINEQIDTVWIN